MARPLFKDIDSLKKDLASKRIAGVQQLVDQGFLEIMKAKDSAEAPARKKYFLAAIGHFEKAIRQAPENAEVQMGFGYIHILIGQFGPAFNYLYQAQKLAPEHPDIKKLVHYLENRRSLENQKANQAADAQLKDQPGFDEVLKKLTILQVQLDSELRRQPDPSRVEIRRLRQNFMNHEMQLRLLTAQTQTLETAFEVAELQRLSEAISLQLKHLNRILQQSLELSQLQQEILKTNQRIAQEIKTFKTRSQPNNEKVLNQLLDQCDHFADKLDTLDDANIPIQAIEPDYNQLIQWLEALQDLFEDLDF